MNDVTITSNNGKVLINSQSSSDKQFSVLTVDGKEVYKSRFVTHAEVALDKGYYVVKISDNNSKICKTVGVLN